MLSYKYLSKKAREYGWDNITQNKVAKEGNLVLTKYHLDGEYYSSWQIQLNKKKSNRIIININCNTHTIVTILKHPNKGKTQLVRKNLGIGLIEEILKNPRLHTDRATSLSILKQKRGNKN